MIKQLTGTPAINKPLTPAAVKGIYQEIPALPGVFKFCGNLTPERVAFYTDFYQKHRLCGHKEGNYAVILVDAYHGDRITQDGQEYRG